MSSAAIAYQNEIQVGGSGLTIGPPGYAIFGGALADLADTTLSTALTASGANEGATPPRLWLLYTPSAPINVDAVGVLSVASVTSAYNDVKIKVELFSGATLLIAWEKNTYQYSPGTFPLHNWFIFDSTYPNVTSIRVTLRRSSAFDDTYIIGGLWIGPLYRHPVGIDSDWSMQIEDPGQMGLSKGAQGYPQLRQKRRVFSGSFGPVAIGSAFGDGFDFVQQDIQRLQYSLGTTKHCVFFPRITDPSGVVSDHLIHRLGIYGAFRDTGTIRHLADDNYSWGPVVFQELL